MPLKRFADLVKRLDIPGFDVYDSSSESSDCYSHFSIIDCVRIKFAQTHNQQTPSANSVMNNLTPPESSE